MYQQEIKFFWPLTEQIPLDLDYSECDTRVSISTVSTGSWAVNAATGASWVTTDFRLAENQTTMLVIKEPNFIRKLIYKIIGFKWEIK